MKNYRNILSEVEISRKNEVYDWQLPDEIVARIKQRLNLSEDRELELNVLLSLKYDVFKETFLDVYDFDTTREGAAFWEEVIADDDYESFYNLYPEINDNYDDSAKFLAAVIAVNEYIDWTPQGEPRGELFNVPIDVIYSMVYNQIKQGNPADVYVFEKNVLMAKPDGGWDLLETDEGSNFWYDMLIDENYKIYTDRYPDGQFIKDVFTDKGLKVWSKILGKSDTIVEINKKPIEDYVSKRMLQFEEKPKRELQEGDNRVDFFVETKDKEIQSFNKEFPDAEKPLKVLLGLLSKKEDERLKNLPEDVKKKAAERKKTFKKQIQDKKQLKSIGVQEEKQEEKLKKMRFRIKELEKVPVGKSTEAEKTEEEIDYTDVTGFSWAIESVKTGTPIADGYVSVGEWERNSYTAINYRENVLAKVMYRLNESKITEDKDFDPKNYTIRVRVNYDDGSEDYFIYDASKFKLIYPESKEEKKEEEKFKVVLAKDEGLDESMGKYYVLREDDKFIAVKTKKLANMVMEDPDGFFKLYFDEGYVVDNLTEMQYIGYKDTQKKIIKKREEDQDLEELKKEIDESCEMDLTLDALACELDELDDI